MNNKTSKTLLNGVLLAAIAAVGITAYQLITSPLDEELIPDEVQVEMSKEKEEQEPSMLDANTSHVTARMQETEKNLSEKGLEMAEEKELDFVAFKEKDSLEKQEEEAEESASTMVDAVLGLEEDVELSDTEVTETAVTNVGMKIPPAAYLDFSENSLMEWPVHGNILLDYAMDQTIYFPTLDQYRRNPAISVQAAEGAPVHASVDGVVYSIADDPRTGKTITMELGNGYQAVYGQLKELTVYEGETVEKGSVIGYVAFPTKYYSEEGSNLYFAMKKDGKPIDPIFYLP